MSGRNPSLYYCTLTLISMQGHQNRGKNTLRTCMYVCMYVCTYILSLGLGSESIVEYIVIGSQTCLSVLEPLLLRESLGRSNQRGSETSQASYGHPRGNLNLVRLFCLSFPLPVSRRLFLFPHSRGHKPATPFTYTLLYQTPGSSAAMPRSP